MSFSLGFFGCSRTTAKSQRKDALYWKVFRQLSLEMTEWKTSRPFSSVSTIFNIFFDFVSVCKLVKLKYFLPKWTITVNQTKFHTLASCLIHPALCLLYSINTAHWPSLSQAYLTDNISDCFWANCSNNNVCSLKSSRLYRDNSKDFSIESVFFSGLFQLL